MDASLRVLFGSRQIYFMHSVWRLHRSHRHTQTHTWLSKRWHHTPFGLRHFVLGTFCIATAAARRDGGDWGRRSPWTGLEPPIPVGRLPSCLTQRFYSNWDSCCLLYNAVCLKLCWWKRRRQVRLGERQAHGQLAMREKDKVSIANATYSHQPVSKAPGSLSIPDWSPR